MTKLTNIEEIRSPQGDILTITPFELNGVAIDTGGTVTGGDGIEVSGGVVSVDLSTTFVEGQTLQLTNLTASYNGAYQFARRGAVVGGTFRDGTTVDPEYAEYAVFYRADGSNWDIVYQDGMGAWRVVTCSANPMTVTDGQSMGLLTAATTVVASNPSIDYPYDSPGLPTLRAPDPDDPDVTYTGGSASAGESYLEFDGGGKLRVNFDQIEADLGLIGANQYRYTAVTVTEAGGVYSFFGLPSTGSVTEVRVIVDVPFSVNPSFTLGDPVDQDSIVEDGLFDFTTAGTTLMMDWKDFTAPALSAYISLGSGSGEARILLQYV